MENLSRIERLIQETKDPVQQATLLVLSIAALGITNTLSRRIGRRRG